MTSSRSSPASAPSPPPEHHRPPRHEEPGDPQPGSASRHRMLPTRRTEGWRRPNPDVAATSSAQIGEPLWGAIRALRSAGHSLAPVLSVCPSSCLGGGPTACAVRSAPSELVVPQYLPSLVPPGVVDICDYELKLPVMHRLPDSRRATTNANGITVRSPIGSSKNAVNLGGKDEPGLNGASSCVPAGGLR